jgi:hypothetical protein
MNRGNFLCKVEICTKYWNKNNGHLVNEFQKGNELVCKENIGVIYVFIPIHSDLGQLPKWT